MDFYKAFATDTELETSGRWVQFDGKTSFKIAREGNAKFSAAFQAEYQKNRAALSTKDDSSEAVAETLMVRVMAKTILVDWSGPVVFNGEDLGAYSREGAEKLLALKEFRAWVSQQAGDMASYKKFRDAEDEKN